MHIRRTSVRSLVTALIVSASFGACRAADSAYDPLPRTETTVLLDLPAVPQNELHECGLATLATLCGYHGVAIPPAERERLAHLAREEHGITGRELRATLRGLGLEAWLFRGALDRSERGLYRHIDQGRVPLVMIDDDAEGDGHYCLVSGYDLGAGSIYIYDPRRGSLCLPTEEFTALWRNAQRFTLLAVPPAAAARHRVRPDHPPST